MNLVKEIAKHKDFEILKNGKIHCKLTKHDIMPNMNDFNNYLKSSSYIQAKDKQFNPEDYLPHLEEDKKNNKFLFCKLTKKHLIKRKSVIEKHVNGKKFKKLVEMYNQQQAELEKNQENGQSDNESVQSIDKFLENAKDSVPKISKKKKTQQNEEKPKLNKKKNQKNKSENKPVEKEKNEIPDITQKDEKIENLSKKSKKIKKKEKKLQQQTKK